MVGVWLSARLTVDGAESRRSEAGLSSTQLAESLPKRCFLGGDKSNDATRKLTTHRTGYGRLEVKCRTAKAEDAVFAGHEGKIRAYSERD
jgi:hypothetical protein